MSKIHYTWAPGSRAEYLYVRHDYSAVRHCWRYPIDTFLCKGSASKQPLSTTGREKNKLFWHDSELVSSINFNSATLLRMVSGYVVPSTLFVASHGFTYAHTVKYGNRTKIRSSDARTNPTGPKQNCLNVLLLPKESIQPQPRLAIVIVCASRTLHSQGNNLSGARYVNNDTYKSVFCYRQLALLHGWAFCAELL